MLDQINVLYCFLFNHSKFQLDDSIKVGNFFVYNYKYLGVDKRFLVLSS